MVTPGVLMTSQVNTSVNISQSKENYFVEGSDSKCVGRKLEGMESSAASKINDQCSPSKVN